LNVDDVDRQRKTHIQETRHFFNDPTVALFEKDRSQIGPEKENARYRRMKAEGAKGCLYDKFRHGLHGLRRIGTRESKIEDASMARVCAGLPRA
jgi:hypothetical protein